MSKQIYLYFILICAGALGGCYSSTTVEKHIVEPTREVVIHEHDGPTQRIIVENRLPDEVTIRRERVVVTHPNFPDFYY